MPKPQLPHVPGRDAAELVEEVGPAVSGVAIGDEVVVNPAVSPLEDVVALGDDSPMGPGLRIEGEHT
jgi:NADPH:quinone reductase-like Zn-dependent oxidoreductase